jgi:hypothetical protein
MHTFGVVVARFFAMGQLFMLLENKPEAADSFAGSASALIEFGAAIGHKVEVAGDPFCALIG